MTTQKETFCRICEPFCPMLADVDAKGVVVKLKPNPDHPSGGTPCNKGLSWLQVHNDPDRLDQPMKRQNPRTEEDGDFTPISWDQSFSEIGEKLRAIRDKHGPNSIALYFGNPTGFDSRALVMVDSLRQHMGTTMIFNPISQDFSNKSYGAGAIYGSPTLWMVPDLYKTDYFLCIGSNPKVSHFALISVPNDNGETLKNIKKRGGKVRFVNPRKIESSTPSTGDTLQIKPGTDVYFLAALLHEIHEAGKFDTALIKRYGKNTKGLIDFIDQYPAEKVASITGIETASIKEVAAELMKAKSAAIYTSTGVNQGRQGLLAYWLTEMLNFTTGNLGKEGGMYLPDGFHRLDMPLPEVNNSVETSVGHLAMGHNYNPLPSTVLPDLIDNGDIKALIMVFGNPLLSTPAEDKLRKSFEKLEVMVAADITRTDTVEMCDYILPGTDWLERADINFFANGAQLRPYVQYTEAIVPPKGNRKNDWWIMARLAQEFGPSDLFEAELANDGFATINQLLSVTGLSTNTLNALPQKTALIEQSPKASVYEKALMHKDGKIDCCPAAFAEAGLFERCHNIFKELGTEPAGTLKLVTMRTIHMHNGWLSNMPVFRKGALRDNPLNISEEDALHYDLFSGDPVRLYNQYGSLETHIVINGDLRAGVVAMTHGFGHHKARHLKIAAKNPGTNVNVLTPTGPDTHEPLSYMTWMTGIPVQLEKLAAQASATP